MSASQNIWSFHGVSAYAGPPGSVTLHRHAGNKRLMVQPAVAQALTHCNTFRSIESHTKTITSVLPALANNANQARDTLLTIANAGLMESGEEAWQRLTRAETNPQSGADNASLIILTCDRPRALRRLLTSLVDKPIDERIDCIWVVDDSRNRDDIAANADVIASIRSLIDQPIHHVDQSLKDCLIAHVVAELPEAAGPLAWLLNRDLWGSIATYGIARNLSLLLSVNRKAVVIDDDVIPEAVAPPLSETSLTVARPNDRQAVFYESEEALNQHQLKLSASPISLILDKLGNSTGDIMTSYIRSHSDLAGWDGNLISHLGAESSAVIVQCGSWGDWGAGSGGASAIFLEHQSIKRLIQHSKPISEVLAANACWFGYRGPVLSRFASLSQMIGIDHRRLMPPYMPAGRGEDLLFGIMTDRLHPESFVFNAGWAICHSPTDERGARANLKPPKFSADVSLLAELLGRESPHEFGLSAERRLAAMAEEVSELASMQHDAAERVAQTLLVSKLNNVLSQCMQHLSQLNSIAGSPHADEWRSFLEASRDSLVADILSSQERPLQDAADRLAAAGIDSLQAQGAALGEALAMWPQICEAASSFSP